VTKRFCELAAEAGLRRVRLHDLRHGAASLRLAAGADIAIVSKVLGHSSVSITSDTYSHLLAGVGRQAAERAAVLVPRNRRDQSVTSNTKTAAPDGSETADLAGQEGAPPGTRTPNPRIKRHRPDSGVRPAASPSLTAGRRLWIVSPASVAVGVAVR
jgi:hypothetical protein